MFRAALANRKVIALVKKDAIESALMYAEGDNGYPHGMKTALIKYGRFDHCTDMFGDVITTVYKLRLSDLF